MVWRCCPGSSGNTADSLEVPSCVLLLCTCGALHTTPPQPLQCQLISTQISYSLSALSLQKLLLYTFTANKCARGLRTVLEKQGKGKCNLKGYSPQNCTLNALAEIKILLTEAQHWWWERECKRLRSTRPWWSPRQKCLLSAKANLPTATFPSFNFHKWLEIYLQTENLLLL